MTFPQLARRQARFPLFKRIANRFDPSVNEPGQGGVSGFA
jgi:hypothetical protein